MQTPSRTTCPCCLSRNLEFVYSLLEVPSHSCLLMPTAGAARDYPCGDVELALCRDCGFLTNRRHDSRLEEYSPEYEETQHFSETFNRFARSLARSWIDQYDLRNKTIVEIGCGKGEFLALMCELGENRGIGIDPACKPERHDAATNARITWIQDYYSEEHHAIEADVIICRHTLEHIPNPRDFVRTLRDAIGTRDCLVLFELPDTTRVLRERAFWDIYYEHCSYFTAGSLARLFRQACFDVTSITRAFDEQYLLIAARPVATPTRPSFDVEHDLEATRADAARFRRSHQTATRGWRKMIDRLAADGRRPVIWGAGSKCVAFCSTLRVNGQIEYLVDINPHKQGKYLPGTGHPVIAPDQLVDVRPEAVIVMNPIYCDEIQQLIEQLGVQATLYPV